MPKGWFLLINRRLDQRLHSELRKDKETLLKDWLNLRRWCYLKKEQNGGLAEGEESYLSGSRGVLLVLNSLYM